MLVSAVAQVGLDVNLAANVSWRRDCLQYVPGLGPRKARALMEAIQVRRVGGWGGEGLGQAEEQGSSGTMERKGVRAVSCTSLPLSPPPLRTRSA